MEPYLWNHTYGTIPMEPYLWNYTYGTIGLLSSYVIKFNIAVKSDSAGAESLMQNNC